MMDLSIVTEILGAVGGGAGAIALTRQAVHGIERWRARKSKEKRAEAAQAKAEAEAKAAEAEAAKAEAEVVSAEIELAAAKVELDTALAPELLAELRKRDEKIEEQRVRTDLLEERLNECEHERGDCRKEVAEARQESAEALEASNALLEEVTRLRAVVGGEPGPNDPDHVEHARIALLRATPVGSMAAMRTTVVLLVDDDHGARRAVERMIDRIGHRCIDVASVAEGLDALTRSEIDLVITDVIMPGRTGFDLLKAIRRLRPQMPVIMISADPNRSANAAAAGVKLLVKPFSIADLQASIANALRDRDLTSRK